MYMDKLNGIQVAEKLRNMNYKGKIIFLTATSKYAVESYDVEASGYLVKPHDIDKISMVLDRVLSNYENVHTYQIKKRNSVIQVLYSEIDILRAVIQNVFFIAQTETSTQYIRNLMILRKK